jgi:hypothetical protein
LVVVAVQHSAGLPDRRSAPPLTAVLPGSLTKITDEAAKVEVLDHDRSKK